MNNESPLKSPLVQGIIVAIITGIFAIIVAIITRSDNNTLVLVLPSPTPIAQVPSATFTIAPTEAPTTTFTPTTTSTSTPTATLTSTAEPTDLLDTSLPLTAEIRDELLEIGIDPESGHLIAQIKTAVLEGSGGLGAMKTRRLNGWHKNFVIGATIQWHGGGLSDECGFIFRKLDDVNFNTTTLVVAERPFVTFNQLASNRWKNISSSPFIPEIGSDDPHELIVVAVENIFTTYLDRQNMLVVRNSAFASGGVSLLIVTQGTTITCTFDDVWLWVPN